MQVNRRNHHMRPLCGGSYDTRECARVVCVSLSVCEWYAKCECMPIQLSASARTRVLCVRRRCQLQAWLKIIQR